MTVGTEYGPVELADVGVSQAVGCLHTLS